MASLVKRPGSERPWQVRYRDHAGRARSEQFARKGDAAARKVEVERAAQTGHLDALDAGAATLAETGVEFFRLHRGEWSPNTAKGHAYVWNAAVEGDSTYPRAAIADLPVRALRKSHVQQFKIDALAAGVPASSVRRALSLITRTLDHAADEGMIAANPAARVKPPSEPEPPRATVVTPEQVEAIRAQMTERDATLISILAYAGLRPHEARALTVEQFGGATLYLDRACGEDGGFQSLKSGHDDREVPICAALAADVAAIAWPPGPMFPAAHGGPWTKTDWDNWRKRRFKRAVVAAGLPADLNPYDLRHSIASLWYREGVDKATIAYRLGHSIPVLEKVYAHYFKALDAGDRRSVDEMIAAARGH